MTDGNQDTSLGYLHMSPLITACEHR